MLHIPFSFNKEETSHSNNEKIQMQSQPLVMPKGDLIAIYKNEKS